MALLDTTTMSGTGIVKELEESALGLVLQNLQQDQYQYPEKSFIREIASNAVDAIEEKKMARSILKGESIISDHYSDIDSELTKDSKFNPDYYNLGFLSPLDEITITYINKDRSVSNRDRIIIEDTGVGLGHNRLKGFFRPAFSTKRLNRNALGKWGIGSKSGLATGVESYQITSRHNGREFHFDIYNDRFYSTVPKFDDEGNATAFETWKVKMYTEDGGVEDQEIHIHYFDTVKPNGLIVLMDVKNPLRNKAKYIDAVKSQLTYFNYVRLFEEYEADSDRNSETFFKTRILYEDEFLAIPEDNYHSVPHLILNGVNYGKIDFGEAEMDEKIGNVGIKGDPSGIDVNQSRELIRYTAKSRESLKKYLENAVIVAQDYINVNMEAYQSDFLKWILACRDIKAKNSRDNVFSRLSGLADLDKVEFTFADTGIKFSQSNFKKIFAGFRVTRVQVSKSKGAFKTTTTDIGSWESFSPSTVYYRSSSDFRYSSILMGYISEQQEYKPDLADQNEISHVYLITPIKDYSTLEIKEVSTATEVKKLLLESSVGILEDVVVPQEYIDEVAESQRNLDKEIAKEKEYSAMSEKEIRDRDGCVLYHDFKVADFGNYRNSPRVIKDFRISRTRREISIEDMKNTFSKQTTIYGTLEDIPLLKTLLHWIDKYERTESPSVFALSSKRLQIIVVSKNIVKYLDKHATHVKRALQDVQGRKLSVMSAVRKYNTASQFRHVIKSFDFQFLHLFEEIDKEAFDTYNMLIDYTQSNGFNKPAITKVPGVESIEEYMDKIRDFQLFLIDNSDPKVVSEKSKELFNNPDLNSCDSVDIEVYSKFKALENYVEGMKKMFMSTSQLIDRWSGIDISFDAESFREYIVLKGIPNFIEFEKSWDIELKVDEYKKNRQQD